MRASLLATALLLAALAPARARAEGSLAELEAQQVALFEKLGPAVVFLSDGKKFGSGFFVSERGLILTSAHVVSGSDSVQVVLASGQRLQGRVVRRAPGNLDLALVQVAGGPYRALRLSPGSDLRVGAWVASVGHGRGGIWAFNTVMVSNIYPHGSERPVFQTQIPLNPGSSGGPIVDRRGRVLGVVTAGITDSNSINFAIRSTVALQSFPALEGACDCLVVAAPAGVPIFVDGRMVGQGPRVFQSVAAGSHEVFAVIGGVMKKQRLEYPARRRVELR